MRTGEEIVDYVDDLIQSMLRRPRMYASTPESFEEILMALDDLRNFAAPEPGDERAPWATYADFLRDRGYDAMSFTGFARPLRALTQEDIELFEKTSAFFDGYLKSRGRGG